MTYQINRLQLGHLQFKDDHFAKLDQKRAFVIESEGECVLGKWIKEMELQGED